MSFLKKLLSPKEDSLDKKLKKLWRKTSSPKELTNLLTREWVTAIRRKNEYPSLGHALDELSNKLKNNMEELLKQCYDKGYLYLLPIALAEALGIFNLTILKSDGKNMIREIYNYPGVSLVTELEFPEEMKIINKELNKKRKINDDKIMAADQVLNELRFVEPGLVYSNKVPKLILSVSYQKYNTFKVFLFDDKEDVEAVVNSTYKWYEDVTEEIRIKKPEVLRFKKNPRTGTDKGMLVLDIPGKPESHYQIWWNHENFLLSAYDNEDYNMRKRDRLLGKWGFKDCYLQNNKKISI